MPVTAGSIDARYTRPTSNPITTALKPAAPVASPIVHTVSATTTKDEQKTRIAQGAAGGIAVKPTPKLPVGGSPTQTHDEQVARLAQGAAGGIASKPHIITTGPMATTKILGPVAQPKSAAPRAPATPVHSQPKSSPGIIAPHLPGTTAPTGPGAVRPSAPPTQIGPLEQPAQPVDLSGIESSLASQQATLKTISDALAQLGQGSPGSVVGAGGPGQQPTNVAGTGGGVNLVELGAAAAAVGILVFAARNKKKRGK